MENTGNFPSDSDHLRLDHAVQHLLPACSDPLLILLGHDWLCLDTTSLTTHPFDGTSPKIYPLVSLYRRTHPINSTFSCPT